MSESFIVSMDEISHRDISHDTEFNLDDVIKLEFIKALFNNINYSRRRKAIRIFILHHLEGYTVGELSLMYNRTRSDISSAINRTKKHLLCEYKRNQCMYGDI